MTISLLWLNACDTVVDSKNTSAAKIETVNIDQDDGSNFTVHLDPHMVPVRKTFGLYWHLYGMMKSRFPTEPTEDLHGV